MKFAGWATSQVIIGIALGNADRAGKMRWPNPLSGRHPEGDVREKSGGAINALIG